MSKTVDEIAMDDASGTEPEDPTESRPKKRGRPRGSTKAKREAEREEALEGLRQVAAIGLSALNDIYRSFSTRPLWAEEQVKKGAFYAGNVIDRYLPAEKIDPDITALIVILVIPAIPEIQKFSKEKRIKNAANGSTGIRKNGGREVHANTGDNRTSP